jgi:nitroreductase
LPPLAGEKARSTKLAENCSAAEDKYREKVREGGFSMLIDLMKKTRSYRRFLPEPAPTMEDLEGLVELARLTPSGANKQPLKYILVREKQALDTVFACLKWAAYLPDWPGPSEQERPTAYIIILSDPALNQNPSVDVGLAAQSIILGAMESGFGACLLASVNRPKLREELGIPENLQIELVAALGTPGEEVRLTEVPKDGDIRYWRDAEGIHYVPKRSREDLIVKTL